MNNHATNYGFFTPLESPVPRDGDDGHNPTSCFWKEQGLKTVLSNGVYETTKTFRNFVSFSYFVAKSVPTYFYNAKSIKGEDKSGISEARDKHELARNLRQQGYILVSADLGEKTDPKKREIDFLNKFKKISLKEKLFFIRNLKVMIRVGISLVKILRILAKQSKNSKFKKILLEVEKNVNQGKSFSIALSMHPSVFSGLFCNMIKIGEESGTLEEVLDNLAVQIEREYNLRSKIKGAMTYPAVILVAMIGIGILMMIVVIPQLAETFEELGIVLPLSTRIIIGIGNFLAQNWFFIIPIILASPFLFKVIFKIKKVKRVIDGISLKIPGISSFIRKVNTAIITRTLGSLIASGVPIVRSLEILSQAMGNFYFKQAIAQTAKEVQKGISLSKALASYQNLYFPIVVQIIEVGEETGETSNILSQLADFYEEEINDILKNLSSIIEPILMIIIGAAVGFFAVSMIQPMYGMVGAI